MDPQLLRKLSAWIACWTLVAIPIGSWSTDLFDGNPSGPLMDRAAASRRSALAGRVSQAGLELAQFRVDQDSSAVNPDRLPSLPPQSPSSRPSAPPTPGKPPRGGGDRGGPSWIGPAVVAGIAAVGLINALVRSESEAGTGDSGRMPTDPVRELLRKGPQLPSQFNASAFAIRGLVRGGWPVVVDYESRSRGQLRLQVSAQGTEVITYDLTKFGPGRHNLRFSLPPQLGDRLKPGLVAVLATSVDGRRPLPDFRLYGVGLGPKAVGSVGIDQLSFDPSSIRTGRRQTAGYRFYSHSEFDHVAVEYFRILSRSEGQANQQVDSDPLRGGIRRNQWIDDPDRYYWDGIDSSGRVSRGDHTLQVRAWAGTGDWVGAWSESLLTVRQ